MIIIHILNEYMRSVIFATLFVGFFELLLPSGKLKNVTRMISGIFIMVTILNPLIKLIPLSRNFNALIPAEQNVIDSKNLNESVNLINKSNNEEVIKIFKENLENDLEKKLEEQFENYKITVDVIVNKEKMEIKVAKIDEIKVDLKAPFEVSSIEKIEGNDKETQEEVKKTIANMLQISEKIVKVEF